MTVSLGMVLGAGIVLGLMWFKGLFAGFAAQRASDYDSGEAIDIRRDLSGPIKCEGVIYGPMGRVSSRFVGDFEAQWDGNRGIMREHFQYDSGSTQDREWRLEVGNDGAIQAEADDLVGMGTGMQRGSAVHLNYRIRLTEDAGGHVLNVTDWMYRAPNGVIVNRSQFRKFGITVAELVATMRRVDAA